MPTEWTVVALVATAIVIPMLAYMVRKNDKQHEANIATLAQHSQALAVIVEQVTHLDPVSQRVGALETASAVLQKQVAVLEVVIKERHDNG